jgi:hypothetical protein
MIDNLINLEAYIYLILPCLRESTLLNYYNNNCIDNRLLLGDDILFVWLFECILDLFWLLMWWLLRWGIFNWLWVVNNWLCCLDIDYELLSIFFIFYTYTIYDNK